MENHAENQDRKRQVIAEDIFRDYCQKLMAGDRRACAGIVDQLLGGGIAITTLYQQLLQRSLYAVGELWERNQISVATEHLATSVTEGLMNRIYAHIDAPETNGRKVVIASVENELHQVGGKMVADVFEMHGWDSHYLGANTPTAELVRYIDAIRPDMLGLSLSVYLHLAVLKTMLDTLTARFPKLPILIGGQAFRHGGQALTRPYDGVHWVASLDALETFLGQNTRPASAP
ncbi:MAG: cobalamin-dependent protein [Desulfobacterales bacterium]|jgi:methanogenic corrinoid protein MtbC1